MNRFPRHLCVDLCWPTKLARRESEWLCINQVSHVDQHDAARHRCRLKSKPCYPFTNKLKPHVCSHVAIARGTIFGRVKAKFHLFRCETKLDGFADQDCPGSAIVSPSTFPLLLRGDDSDE